MDSFFFTPRESYSLSLSLPPPKMSDAPWVVATATAAAAAAAFAVVVWRIRRAEDSICECVRANRLSSPTTSSPSSQPPPLTTSKGVNTTHDDSTDDFLQVKHYDAGVPALEGRTAGAWCYDKRLVSLHEGVSVSEALEAMHSARVTCALFYGSDGTLLGVFDTPDVVRYLLRCDTAIQTTSARRVLRQCVVAPAHVSLSEVCKHLRAGLRYVAVCSDSGGHQIVSQRAVAAALVEASGGDDAGSLGHVLSDKLVRDVLDESRHVVTCADTACAREAFVLMAAYGITSVPVVDHSGHACAVISATDVLYARRDASARFDLNVLAYLAQSRSDAAVARPVHTIVSCSRDDDVLGVLRLMMHEEVHHVYVLDAYDVPTGVVSFVDLLKCV